MTEMESNYTKEHIKDGYRVMVAGHELFGHGSGRLIYADDEGKCPQKFKDPLSGEEFESCYQKGETYSSRFGEFSSSYEECRADLSGLHLQIYPEVYALGNWAANNVTDLFWLNLDQQVRKGILGIPSSYSFDKQKWKQAHTQGAWVIT
jgi:dipeptidyl-peptidase-3